MWPVRGLAELTKCYHFDVLHRMTGYSASGGALGQVAMQPGPRLSAGRKEVAYPRVAIYATSVGEFRFIIEPYSVIETKSGGEIELEAER